MHGITKIFAGIACIMLCFSCSSKITIFPGEKWESATPESQDVDGEKLELAAQYLKTNAGHNGVDELFIVRNGYVIYEGDSVDTVHGIWSQTKSFTSTALGLLIDDGKCTLDTPAKKFVPELVEHYGTVTLRHFTTMTSGYRAIGDDKPGDYRHGPSQTPYLPSLDPLFKPGEQFRYWDSAMNEFALVLTRIAEEPLDDLLRRRVLEPIGLKPHEWKWGTFDTIDGLRINGGAGNYNKHMMISARAMSRFGWLYLNEGRWNGRQLISADWVREASTPHPPEAAPPGETGGTGTYGCNWWVNGTERNGEHKWPEAPPGTFSASGHNNNDMFIIPEWNMVVTRLGLDQNDIAIDDPVWSHFLGLIGEALK